MKFNSQLHEDLYGLFIFSFLKYDVSDANEEQFTDTKERVEFELIESLFPQEHCPEQYERWVSDFGLSRLNNGAAGTICETYERETGYFKHKIIIAVSEV